ncbi:beta-galactosidase [Haloplasma contractile]|uniref:Beta-galactosidase n=1 Tax=Haloplasma contractile SSD-17B TaxID=1033810 RepID=U2FJV4_9MOLU|nr:beta-galactosidase [Haloplasma contractile]ERJ13100.1 Beta-galactosidase Carbohydrate transport protein [Haloplasma contractile SSD-17B]
MYLGVDYYPEHWDIFMIDDDLIRMKEMGVNIIRIGEFAWHLMEQTEGNFDFSMFDYVIKKAEEYNLDIMFGTPTATFPAWLAKKHPSILSEDQFGNVRVFGGRRQYCFNSKHYLEYSLKIVKKLVEHYKGEKRIKHWQIDNEFGHEGSDLCYCKQCEKAFQNYLKQRYLTIDQVNETYGTIFWGQTYNDFSEIPVPKPTITTHNPTLKLDWARFRSYSINEFAKKHIELVRKLKGKHQKVTHNFFGGFFDKCYDQNEMSRQLDYVSYDNYPVWGGLKEPITPAHIAMTHDYIRGLKQDNYWIVEELMGAQGHDVIGYLPRPNQAKMWSYQAMAHGCNNLLYFRWRGMTKGAEQFCFGIIDHDNEKGRKYEEVKSFFNDIKNHKDIIDSKINADIAVLYDFDNIWSWKSQQQSKEFNFTNELLRLYSPFYELNTTIDVLSIEKDFNNYKVVVLPVMQIINEELKHRIDLYLQNGGTVIFSYRAGIKNRDNNINFEEIIPCQVREMTGIRIKEVESLQHGQEVTITGVGLYEGKVGVCGVWRDLIIPETAEVLYQFTDKFYGTHACITRNQYKNGTVYYIGGGVDSTILNELAEEIVINQSIPYISSEAGLEVYRREHNRSQWLIVTNHTAENKTYNSYTFKPYESRIIKKNNNK